MNKIDFWLEEFLNLKYLKLHGWVPHLVHKGYLDKDVQIDM